MVLMNNIFNAHEFELYGRVKLFNLQQGATVITVILVVEVSCMKDISVSMILESVNKFSKLFCIPKALAEKF